MNKQSLELDLLMKEPFKWLDTRNLRFSFFNFNLFQNYTKMQKTAFWLAVVGAGAWLLFGFDSNAGQLMHVLVNIPNFVLGRITVDGLVKVWVDMYGKDFHYSALVIYGFCFYFLSKHFEKFNIRGSKNIAFASVLTWLSIGIFELYWMASFSFFQGQTWVLRLQMPQLRIIIQNIFVMFVAGGLGALYMYAESCKFNKKGDIIGRLWRFNWGKLSVLLVGLSVGLALFWWYYPGYVETFSVTYETGEVWTNNRLFPQTLYTVDVNPSDSINAGVWFWVENDLIHGLNTLVKILFTLTIFNIGRIRKP